jgi:hypothetical protein
MTLIDKFRLSTSGLDMMASLNQPNTIVSVSAGGTCATDHSDNALNKPLHYSPWNGSPSFAIRGESDEVVDGGEVGEKR